jgi:DNA modification methylase
MMTSTILQGDVREVLPTLDAGSVQCVVTSPPYWGLRDYGVRGQMGLEKTPEDYVETLVEVFREVRRVLRDDGTVWLNLGDSYSSSGGMTSDYGPNAQCGNTLARVDPRTKSGPRKMESLPPKNLVGIPWRVAFALQADGWYLRSDIIWHKPNPMPESVTDRPTKSHEYLFLLTKSPRYYYDADAVREAYQPGSVARSKYKLQDIRTGVAGKRMVMGLRNAPTREYPKMAEGGRNLRSVWTITTQPYSAAHFATFPTALVEPCVKAGSTTGDLILDPFAGSGTVGCVALKLGRTFVGIELNPEYCTLARNSIDGPLFAQDTR